MSKTSVIFCFEEAKFIQIESSYKVHIIAICVQKKKTKTKQNTTTTTKNYQLKIKRTMPLKDLDQEQADSRDLGVIGMVGWLSGTGTLLEKCR